jgi:hypothetical protein
MDDPSKPMPSLKVDSSSSPIIALKCCHVPGRSTNLKSTIFSPSLRAKAITSLGVVSFTALVSFVASSVILFSPFDQTCEVFKTSQV